MEPLVFLGHSGSVFIQEVKMVEILNLSKSFSKNKVIDKLNLNIETGKITALVGKNGAGKSTLIRLISGILKPDGGEIRIEKNAGIGTLMGGDIALNNYLSGKEIITFYGQINNLSRSAIEKRIDELDETLHFKSFYCRRSFQYSRGMRQKIAFANCLISNPDLLLLDEPSTGLDLETANDVIEFIKFLKSKNKSILVATHNIFEISDLSDNIAILKDGKTAECFLTADFFKNSKSDEKSKCLMSALN